MDEGKFKKLLEQLEKGFNESISRLKNEVNERLESVSTQVRNLQTGVEVISKQQQTTQTSIDRMDRDIGEDRKQINDIDMRVGNVYNQQDEIRSLFTQQTQKIKETVHDAVKDRVEPVSKNVTEIKELMEEVSN